MKEATRKWYIEKLTAPQILNRNMVRFTDSLCQWWRDENGNDRKLTYGQTWQIVKEISCGLMDLGFKKGDRAAVMCNTSPQWLWSDFGILCAGGITVCVYPTLSENEAEHIIRDSGSKIIFVEDQSTLNKIETVISSSKNKALLKYIILMNGEYEGKNKKIITLKNLQKKGILFNAKDRAIFEDSWKSVEFRDDMTIVYTSGTTGLPKGAVHTHESFASAINRDCNHVPEAKDDDMSMSFLPLSHTYERECGQGSALQAKMPIAYSSPKTLVDDLKYFKPTMFVSVPRIYERVYMAMRDEATKSPVKKALFDKAMETGIKVIEARADKNGFVDMSEGISLTKGAGFWLGLKYKFFDRVIFSKVRQAFGGKFRYAVSAAGSLSADLCKTFMAMGITIIEGYGSTETFNDVTVNRINKILPGSVGALSTTSIQGIVAEDGELLIKGDNLFSGYWKNPKATKEAFTDEGYFKTGDIVEVVADGYYKIVDRKKGLMVLDTGKNVASNRIESLFSLSRYIDIVVPIGSERKYVTAIISPNFDAFIEYFNNNKIAYDKSCIKYSEDDQSVCIEAGEDFTSNEKFREIIENEVAGINEQLESYEKVKKYSILNRKFTEDSGELTPTLKVKRRIIIERYADKINQMYETD